MIGARVRRFGGRKAAIAALVSALLVAALVVAGLTRPWSRDQVEQEVAAPEPGDRVLQSVQLAVQPDGALTEVNDTVVIARAGSGNADTTSTSYDPNAVVDQLPVRVLTSYRRGQRTGTDLSELKGYTGRVSIDLRVENLTVRPQRVRYDVAGQSRTSTAMVGVPLTVVASATLPNTDPSTVVTDDGETGRGADQAEDAGATNGVLSQDSDTTTQVQWATILAPPQLGATATLRLVVDAHNFTLPSINLSVQPGLVTDPSLGALVDAALSPERSQELALQSRMIGLVGDVNDVLARASKTISTLRKTLDSTSNTLGTKTVSALRSNTQDVTSSMESLRENLNATERDLTTSLEATGSATLATMADTVAQLDQVLGDTSVKPPAAKMSGDGCDQKVVGASQSASVYASLQQVAAQLDGYAAATATCKVLLQRAIADSIGPAEPSDKTCTTPSLTCSLAEVGTSFAGIADKFVADGQLALKGLGPDGLQPVSKSLAALVAQLGGLNQEVDGLLEPRPAQPPAPTIAEIDQVLANAGDTVDEITKALDQVHQDALDGAAEARSMGTQNADLAAQLCALVGNGTTPGTLSGEQVETLRAFLTDRSCPDPAGTTDALPPPTGYDASMSTRLTGQARAFELVATLTDIEAHGTGAGGKLTRLDDQLASARKQLEQLANASEKDDKQFAERVTALGKSVTGATETASSLGHMVVDVGQDYAKTRAGLAAALEKASEAAKTKVQRSIDTEVRRVSAQGKADSEQVGEMFERSASGLSSTAKRVQQDGARAVQVQHERLDRSQARAAQTLSNGTKSALTQVSRDVSGSTRDLEATRVLLTRDLADVLLDLGDRKVRGSGVLGALATSTTAAGSADFQLGLASDKGSAYAAVRERDVDGIMLRQAQAEAALERQATMTPFARTLPSTVQHRTIYVFRLDGGR